MSSHVRLAIIRTLDLEHKGLPIKGDETLLKLKGRMTAWELKLYQREIKALKRYARAEEARRA